VPRVPIADIVLIMTDEFTATLSSLQRGEGDPAELSAAFLPLFPVNGATVATVGAVLGNETLSATGELARRLDELQFDLGEGPCWDAVSHSAPILEQDFPQNGPRRWPSLSAALRDERIGSVFAFPMTVGSLRVGAVDLYAHVAGELDSEQQRRASALADVIARRVVREALAVDPDQNPAQTPFTRRVIHQAAGFVLAQVDVDPEEATLLIQAHAFTSGRSMQEIAESILAGRLTFVRVGGRIEVRS
jgi:hypothetical protein